MLKKASDDVKKRIVFFIDFSSIFREKSTENRAKSVETSFVHKNRRKSTFGTPFFSKKSIFSEFLGFPRVPRGVPGRPGKFTKSLIFLIHGELRLKTSPDGLREASGRPRRSPRRPQDTILRRFSDRFCASKTKENIQKMLKITHKILKNS